MEKKKRYIPGTNPDWNLELPDGDLNSLVTKDGESKNYGWNFDERDDPDDEITFEGLEEEVKFNPEAAEEARKQAVDKETE